MTQLTETQKQKQAIIRLMLFSHFTRDDLDALEGTRIYRQSTKRTANMLIKDVERNYATIPENVFSTSGNVEISMMYWQALEKVCNFLSSLALDEFIGYAESLNELTPTEK